MKNIFYILLLLPTIIFAQYPNNSGHKITLGEQTTADGLIWRGVAADTTLTVKSDTAAYFVLDTANLNLYTYKVSASGKKWIQLGSDTTSLNLVSRFLAKLNISDTASMLTPYFRKLDTTNIKYVNTYGTQTVNGAKTFSSTVTATRFNPTSSSVSGNGMYLAGTDTLGFSTAGTQKMQIASSGNVGVGVTPSAWTAGKVVELIGGSLWALDQNHIGFVQNAFLNTSGYKYIANASAGYYIQAQGDHRWYTAPSGTAGATITFTERLTLLKDGNVGIGTESPSSRLVVKGVDGTSTNSALNVTNSSNASLLFVRNDGKVGIGTSNPNYQLEIVGNQNNGNTVRIDSYADDLLTPLLIRKSRGTFTNPVALIANDMLGGFLASGFKGDAFSGNVGGVLLRAETNFTSGLTQTYLEFTTTLSTGREERMRITSGGNVGIGTTSPGSRLVVKGVTNTSGESALNVTNSSDVSLLNVRNDGLVTLGTPLPLTSGGTGATTATAALNALLPTQSQSTTIGATLKSNGTNSYWDNFSAAGTVQDQSGNFYNTVAIGTQVWFKENLRTKKYRSGALIPVKTNTDTSTLVGQIYYYANDSLTNYSIYGALYNWKATQSSDSLCPSGWHVPTDAEWTTLTTYLGGESVAGGKMKTIGTTYWNSPNTGATNESGFSVLPGGFRYFDGTFYYIREYAFFWSATENGNSLAWYRSLYSNFSSVIRISNYKSVGASVRCLKN